VSLFQLHSFKSKYDILVIHATCVTREMRHAVVRAKF